MKIIPALFDSSLLRSSTVFLALLLMPIGVTYAQSPGSVDTSFNPGTGANNSVFKVRQQPDGKVVIVGQFTSFNGASRNNLARLSANGSLDSTFAIGSGTDFPIDDFDLQKDGKIVIGGGFLKYAGVTRRYLARLNGNGTLDNDFNPGSGANSFILATVVQPDGKILIGGYFTGFNSVASNRIARLNADGSLDTTFAAGVGADNVVRAISLQADGKIVIVGDFSTFNGISRNRVARLNASGSLDTTFNPGLGVNAADTHLYAVGVQTDGRILIGGAFTSYNGTPRNRLARLKSDGSLDTSFNPGTGADSDVRSLIVEPNKRILIGGTFRAYNGVARNGVARLNTNGSLDTAFNSGTGLDGYAQTLGLQSNGAILVGGSFSTINGVARKNIARLIGDSSDVTNPGFFTGQVPLGNGVFYLAFPNGNFFGYYSYLTDPRYIFHFDLGYEYVFDAADGVGGVYLYDFTSGHFFYTSSTFPFPYLYDFTLKATLYYYPDPSQPGHYNTSGTRYFYNTVTGQTITL